MLRNVQVARLGQPGDTVSPGLSLSLSLSPSAFRPASRALLHPGDFGSAFGSARKRRKGGASPLRPYTPSAGAVGVLVSTLDPLLKPFQHLRLDPPYAALAESNPL